MYGEVIVFMMLSCDWRDTMVLYNLTAPSCDGYTAWGLATTHHERDVGAMVENHSTTEWPQECHSCHAIAAYPKDIRNGRQRWLCKQCGKQRTIAPLHRVVLVDTKKGGDKLKTYQCCVCSVYYIQEANQRCKYCGGFQTKQRSLPAHKDTLVITFYCKKCQKSFKETLRPQNIVQLELQFPPIPVDLGVEIKRPRPSKNTDKHFSLAHRQKISLAMRGNIPWSTGKKMSEEFRQKVSLGSKGRPMPEKAREKLLGNKYWLGRQHTPESKLKIANAKRGSKSHFWKGGVTKANSLIRDSVEYDIWRKAVFERDQYTCQFCRRKGGKLNADHIKPFGEFPEHRFDVDNGRTLCEDCHKTTDTYGGRANRRRKPLESTP